MTHAAAGTPAPDRPLSFAHRGSSARAPQNTMAAFERAARSGASGVEIDVHLTRDGVVVLMHDDTVDATTDGTGAIARLTVAELRALDAGSWFGPGFAGERVPTWEEFLRFADREPHLEILLEIKGEWGIDAVEILLAPLAPGGAFAHLAPRVIAQSFWPSSVAACRDALPSLRRGLLVLDLSAWDPSSAPEVTEEEAETYRRGPLRFAAVDEAIRTAADLEAEMLNPMGSFLASDPTLVDRIHAAGLRAMVWTLNAPDAWALAARSGADGVITDDPEGYAAWSPS
ncbi:glycerophosphodiester phosphodiesterase family protein [Microbacterium betulae]|uniref:Glycerophosphodiester phosphodiesterase family protein n=1 Tax=Microbacterium betulae TaxID=2981139 RepID=A0AA97FI94_9MICO|nr:glycerophosphodiester phosphodiesterase family protein [Microbacterium sp. AB]WOF22539.1 glycerophosphodiester phosphodiesterase family protein [Microbacterium sp. AB]